MIVSVATLARQSLLVVLCGGAIGVLGNAILNNPTKASLREPAKFDYPQQVPLPITMLASKPLADHAFPNKQIATGMSYRYDNKPQPIDIQIRYVTDGVGNRPTMDAMLPQFSKVPVTAIGPATMKQQPGVGFYSLFVDRKTAYFGTCISPQGISTVTGDQFHNNSSPNPLANGIPFYRILPWLMGRQTFRESRCLWTLLSTPIDEANPDATMKTLETTGVNWIRWWRGNFPAV